MKKRKILATGGLLTTLFLANGNQTAFAQSLQAQDSPAPASSQHVQYKPTYRPEMAEFGLDADEFMDYDQLDELSRQSLQDEGFSASQIHKMLSKKPASTGR